MNKRAEQVAQERRRRTVTTTSGFSSKFHIPDHLRDDATYRYHWVLDEPGRVQELQGQDWDFVEIPEMADDANQKGSGTRLERHGMTNEAGHAVRHVAMRKLRKYDDEDTAREQAIIDERMTSIKGGQAVNSDGKPIATDAPGRRRYVPEGGITITRGS